MYSICMIHSVLILNVPMFKRRTHKLSEQMFKRCSTNKTPVFIYERNSVTCVQFKCLMFQIEHLQGVEPVFAFNICCIALNASLCSSLEHVLAFKMCSMKNICVQVLHTGSVQYYRTRSRCSISVALLVFKLCSIPEHMFLNTCKRSVPSDQLVFFLVKPFSTWCSNSVLSPLTLWCSILQNTFKAFNICCDFGFQMVF